MIESLPPSENPEVSPDEHEEPPSETEPEPHGDPLSESDDEAERASGFEPPA
jgi:hypothetical protein